MSHLIVRATTVSVIRPFVIEVTFHDHSKKRIDLEAILSGPLYGELKNENLFNQVEIDLETGVIQWPNGADFDPETLYNWDLYSEELIERASNW